MPIESLLLCRETSGEQHDSAKCARFRRDRDLRPLEVTPDLSGDEPTSKPKMIPSGGSIPGESALKARAAFVQIGQTVGDQYDRPGS
jgi:hypothetical protein